jgi:hypothetical protein
VSAPQPEEPGAVRDPHLVRIVAAARDELDAVLRLSGIVPHSGGVRLVEPERTDDSRGLLGIVLARGAARLAEDNGDVPGGAR